MQIDLYSQDFVADKKTLSKSIRLEATTCFVLLPRKWAGPSVHLYFAASPEVLCQVQRNGITEELDKAEEVPRNKRKPWFKCAFRAESG